MDDSLYNHDKINKSLEDSLTAFQDRMETCAKKLGSAQVAAVSTSSGDVSAVSKISP